MDKTYIYEQSREVPNNAQKSIVAGRLKGKTDINPMWRIKKLTELFGPAGIGWRFDQPIYEEKTGARGEVMVHCSTALYIRQDEGQEWSAPIPGVGGAMLVAMEKDGLHTDDDAYKKAYTDAQSVACKALGIGADVYWNADSTKYTSPQQTARQAAPRSNQNAEVAAAADMRMILTCGCCGKPVQDVVHKGNRISNTKIAKETKEKYGRVLCWECAKKQPKEDGGLTHA